MFYFYIKKSNFKNKKQEVYPNGTSTCFQEIFLKTFSENKSLLEKTEGRKFCFSHFKKKI